MFSRFFDYRDFLKIPGIREFFAVSGFSSPGFEIFLVLGFLSPGFGIFLNFGIFIPRIRDFFEIFQLRDIPGIFYPRDPDFFREMEYPDKKPTLNFIETENYTICTEMIQAILQDILVLVSNSDISFCFL